MFFSHAVLKPQITRINDVESLLHSANLSELARDLSQIIASCCALLAARPSVLLFTRRERRRRRECVASLAWPPEREEF